MTNLTSLGRAIRLGVILLEGLTEVMDVGPIDMLNEVSHNFQDLQADSLFSPELKAQAIDLDIHWVSEAGPSRPSRLTGNMMVTVTDSFETCPPLDVVLIGATLEKQPSEGELAFIRKSFNDSSAFITTCAGILPAVMAGITEGKTATGPRFLLEPLRKQSPATKWVERRWVQDGKLWTSGALLNGQDLMTNFIKSTFPSGDGTLVDRMAKVGAWPDRDVDYKDVPWKE
ncbi:hypothetical protein HIM_06990 [Hirsutella minnesotensis 3608]|uniref:DJ-1/PfpI domain-containing protein n=1 Tax=Hirsutella minnesotensis 3608 TaxID=1043627 RepID=A0A0F7ZZ60_9HYPO|nr:hypothetical protein HIM_06990 [Hirsutella minnesotensis 3608]